MMIPPSKELRLKSILRWMQDHQPERFAQLKQSGELETKIKEMDQEMEQAFERGVARATLSLLHQGNSRRKGAVQEFNCERQILWREIRERFLPVIAEPESLNTA